jgi:putative inorganic carbon (hco3(-)) transporter
MYNTSQSHLTYINLDVQSKKAPPRETHPPLHRRLRPLFIKSAFWIPAVLVTLFAAWNIAARPEDAFIWGTAIILAILLARHEQLALYLFIFMPVAGELVRLQIGPENGILPTDLLIPFFIAVWLAKKIVHGQTSPQNRTLPKSPHLKPLVVFCAVAALSLLQAFIFLKPSEVISGSFYLIRFASYALIYLAVADIFKTEKQAIRLFKATIIAALLIAATGFIQLAVYPDLGKLEEFGWDPHINRLVSTWLDPNFIGGFLAFITCVIFGVAAYVKKSRAKITLYIVTAILLAALFLTYSRSAYLAAGAGVTVLGILKSRKLLIAFLVIFILAIGLSPRAEERVTDLGVSINSFIFNTSDNPDPTARLRIKSWEQTIELISKRPLLGSGYNTLRYVNYNEGYVSDPKIHSASGSDSSLLTVLATTGVIGLIPFIWFYLSIVVAAFNNWRDKKLTGFARGISLGLFAGIISLFCHSLFVNSLFFPQILIPVAVIIGIMEAVSERWAV